MAVILRIKLSVVWNEVCRFSGPVIMAVSRSGESSRVVDGIPLPRPPPLWLATLAARLCSPVGKAVWAGPAVLPPQALATLCVSFAGLMA